MSSKSKENKSFTLQSINKVSFHSGLLPLIITHHFFIDHKLKLLTICLSPAHIVSQVLVIWIENDPSIKHWWIEKLLRREKLAPIKHIRRGKQGDNIGYQLAGENRQTK